MEPASDTQILQRLSMILVVGATGVLGREVVQQLLGAGHQVRALVRSPVLSRLMAMSIWTDTTDQTFDPKGLIRDYPITFTRVEDFIREQVGQRGAPLDTRTVGP